MSSRITRKLAREDQNGNREIIGQGEIETITGPVIILGDAGLGKSILTETLGDLPSMRYVPAGTFVRTADPALLIDKGQRIVIDGLDEIASSTPGGGIDTVLLKLSELNHPPFILSCREVDWRGAADRIKIQDDYGAEPVLLHLQPFEQGDAHEFLSHQFPELDAPDVLLRLSTRGLDGIYKNPLTLRLLGEIAQSEPDLPETRAELLDSACLVMVTEENPHHDHAATPQLQMTPEQLLSGAGAICATQLLCDRIGVYQGQNSKTPDGFVNISDIAAFPLGDVPRHALRTRLFKATGENRFTYVHRVVAEYLGAKWLAACFEQGCSQKRLFALLRHGKGVPTSLRGLHAWIAHFSTALASHCIHADPYAVLRYGDAERLGLTQALDLLLALKNLSRQDPYFRSEDWGRHPASGLIRSELKDQILSITCAPGKHPQLSMLLIEAMIGAPIVEEFAQSLLDIAFDPGRAIAERSYAAKALHESQIQIAWDDAISCLLQLADANSARLAYNIVARLGARELPNGICVEAVLSHLGLTEATVSQDTELIGYIRRNLFSELDADRLGELLDQLVASAKPFLKKADTWARSALADLVRRRALEVLQANASLPAPRVWTWISAFDSHDGHDKFARQNLGRCIRNNHTLHQSLLEYVLLTPCASNPWMSGYALHDVGLDLYPTPEDVCTVLRILGGRLTHTPPIDPEIWSQVLRLVRTADGLSETVRTTAREIADGDSELLAILNEMSTVTVAEWQHSQERRDAEDFARREAFCQLHRQLHLEHTTEVAAGKIDLLTVPAAVYLGRSLHFRDDRSPHSRVLEFLGVRLGTQALDGFIAVLEQVDLPSAREIAEADSHGSRFDVQSLLICGVAELLRRAQPLSAISEQTLSAAYMSWQGSAESSEVDGIDIGESIEAVLFQSAESIEAHFRASIEPQLASKSGHVIALYQFAREARWRALAARLAIDWIGTYPAMPTHARRELVMCALAGPSQPTANALLIAGQDLPEDDIQALLLHLLTFFVLDFDNRSAQLEEIILSSPDFIWLIRDLAKWPGAQSLSRFSISQLAFIVNVLGVLWPDTQRPTGTTVGETNPWDASQFIRSVIFSLATNHATEATDALQKLVHGPAASYSHIVRRALAQQRQVRLDFEYTPPTVALVQSVMAQGLPESVDDMRAYLLDRLDTLQARMHASDTDTWETYWANGKPRNENYCRNRMIDQISGTLPEPIRFVAEPLMPGQTRADIAAVRGSISLPIEIKGQWHKDVWDAAIDQLDAKYASDWHAQGRGVYLVLWFGDAPGKQLRVHPDGLPRPDTPESLRGMLETRLPDEKRPLIRIYVMDVSKPR